MFVCRSLAREWAELIDKLVVPKDFGLLNQSAIIRVSDALLSTIRHLFKAASSRLEIAFHFGSAAMADHRFRL